MKMLYPLISWKGGRVEDTRTFSQCQASALTIKINSSAKKKLTHLCCRPYKFVIPTAFLPAFDKMNSLNYVPPFQLSCSMAKNACSSS